MEGIAGDVGRAHALGTSQVDVTFVFTHNPRELRG